MYKLMSVCVHAHELAAHAHAHAQRLAVHIRSKGVHSEAICITSHIRMYLQRVRAHTHTHAHLLTHIQYEHKRISCHQSAYARIS